LKSEREVAESKIKRMTEKLETGNQET
jgi:hypothetical protein